MTTLIFLATLLAILILVIRVIVKLVQHKSITSTLRIVAILVGSYSVLWSIFYFSSSYKTIPLGTEICFDDWCATITKIERPSTLGDSAHLINPHGEFIVLHIRMSNEARGIAQKPSNPRVHIVDAKGTSYSFSDEGQKALEDQLGRQLPIDSKLELHQSLETQIVFDIPGDAKGLKVLIEEGPFITNILFRENNQVFVIPDKQ